MGNHGTCPKCGALNPLGTEREQIRTGDTVCGLCDTVSRSKDWVVPTPRVERRKKEDV